MDTNVATPSDTGEPVYPLPAPPDDGRFTYGLVIDVAAALVKHGYPAATSGNDLAALMQALHTFLYRPIAFAPPASVTEMVAAREVDNADEPEPVPGFVDGNPMTGRPVSAPPAARSGGECPPECRQNWTSASDPLKHVAHCPVGGE